ncbi:hypothetical protein D5039_18595 [Verminephrobacter aporrectodeae subsp. tuberculatae]|uniref:Lipoprotein n=1 Tax=Verminephrobacter aporrectodeae subsp. tuberculatae TaxID=1110392 RepID=A0ABT3KZ47_9BURK|nr:hypothetical protein [Verminephrobacter aporrectodeae subsp. tuberculatae]
MARHIRFLFWLLACGLSLAACNGGGDAQEPGAVARDAMHGDLFIAPAGALCARRERDGNCVQPTSSSTDELALHKAMTNPDPDAPMINFDSPGHLIDGSLTKDSLGNPAMINPSYGLVWRHIQAGRNRFVVDGRRYGNAKRHPSAAMIDYTGEHGGGINLTFNLEMGQNQAWFFSFAEHGLVSHRGTANWSTSLGLLTDQTDAPTTRKVTYVGTYHSISGTAERLDENGSTDFLYTHVTYEAELDLHTGSLSGVRIDYTNPETQRHTRLKLPDLTFKHSRLEGISRTQRFDIEIDGPAEIDSPADERPGAPRPDTPRIRHDFTIETLEGDIVGKQAALINLWGTGPKGIVRVVLVRKDLFELMGKNPVIHYPLTPAKP